MGPPELRDPGLSPRTLLLLGAVSLLLALGVFLTLAWNVASHTPLARLDAAFAAWVQAHRSPGLTAFLYGVTQANSTLAICMMALVLLAVLARLREWDWMATVTLAVGGGLILNLLLKGAYGRARPAFEDALVTLTTYSFPSGHTAGATAFYGVLAAFLVARTGNRAKRAAIVTAALSAVALVAFSRVYLGAHYLSDVVAAVGSTSAWLVSCLLVMHSIVRRGTARQAGEAA